MQAAKRFTIRLRWWQNQGTELGVSDLSCLSRHHSDQLAGLLTRFRRRRTRRRTLCPFIDLMLLYMPRRQKASTIFSFRRNGRHSTVENGWTQKGTGFIGLLKILSYAKPVIPRPVRRLVVGIRSLFAGFLFRSSGCFSFVGSVPPAAHFSHQLEKWAKAHTIVSADFQPRCGVKTGTLPRNRLAVSATGGASAVSSQ